MGRGVIRLETSYVVSRTISAATLTGEGSFSNCVDDGPWGAAEGASAGHVDHVAGALAATAAAAPHARHARFMQHAVPTQATSEEVTVVTLFIRHLDNRQVNHIDENPVISIIFKHDLNTP